ncbi:hypothetical protein [Streptomyces abikoensis]|uniref:hypothetical protein n=1 Tax=Streptomyces abikoensis TaxID=97398 RepID=UPI001678C790|nr:hypothetical protein [Streptomyces abikoensis]GGP63270.1 hypothetical protein GCM10010214_41430 [Streptomyces abikoensis]
MFWPMLAIALGFCGLAVLTVLAARVFVETRRLARQVAEASRRVTRAAEDLEQAAAPLAAQSARTLRKD